MSTRSKTKVIGFKLRNLKKKEDKNGSEGNETRKKTRKTGGKKMLPIYLVYRPRGGSPGFCSTGLYCKEGNWKGGYPNINGETKEIRRSLDKMRDEMEEWYLRYCNNRHGREPTKEEFRAEAKKWSLRAGGDDEGKAKTLVEGFDEFIEDGKKEGKASSTLKKYGGVRGHLNEFAPNKRLDQVDEDFGEAYKDYLERKGFETSTIDKDIGILKTMLKKAEVKEQVKSGTSELISNVKVPKKQPIPIEPEEMAALTEACLPTKTLDETRDLFLFSCYTGLRIGDLMELSYENFVEKEMKGEKRLKIKYDVNKQRGEPHGKILSREAQQILEKYDRRLPSMADPYYNRCLKDLFKHLGLKREVQIQKFYGRNAVSDYEIKPLYDAVSSHKGRQTFITNFVRNGAPNELTRRRAGLKDQRVIETYVTFNEEDEVELEEHFLNKGRTNESDSEQRADQSGN